MAHSTYSSPIHFGFLSICEGIILSLIVGWWLQAHGQPTPVFVAVAVLVSALYFLWLSVGSGTALTAPIMVLSMAIWAVVGWYMGQYAFQILTKSHVTMTFADTAIIWKVVGAMLLGFLAYCDKVAMVRQRAY